MAISTNGKPNSIPKPYLRADLLLCEDRYRIEELISDNDIITSYKAYDIFRKKFVVIRELFPRAIAERAAGDEQGISVKLMSDEACFRVLKDSYKSRAKKLIGMYPLEYAGNVLTFFEENGTVYVVEEALEDAVSLKEFLLKRHSAKFTTEDLLKYLDTVFALLAKLHKKGFWHGSINPDNIMIGADRKAYLVHLSDPMDVISRSELGDPAIRDISYTPVELYVEDANRGPAADIFEMGAVLYRYVTGLKLLPYYERVNDGKEPQPPKDTLSRVMDFQSDAILKAVALYDFDRYTDITGFFKDLSPDDMDTESLFSDQEEARHFKKLPFWYRREVWAKRWYLAAVVALAVIFLVLFIPRSGEIITDIRINGFYDRFNKASDYEKCRMLAELDQKKRTLFTNDYMDLPDDVEDEERAKMIVPKYYDFQLDHYVEGAKVNTDRKVYEYMKIDYLLGQAYVTYLSNEENSQSVISLKPDRDGGYTINRSRTDKSGNQTSETITAKPENEK